MGRSVVGLAKNSRHRFAATALYRALLRTGNRIPLPQDLHPNGPIHPVVYLIRKRVSKNKVFDTPRLVYSSMAAGYRFLTLLTKAQTESNPEYNMVIGHLRKRAEVAAESRRINELNRRRLTRRRKTIEPRPPLLTKISHPGEPPKYISTVRPRPKSMFKGDRKVPVLSATADGIPYLRTMKPQPHGISQSVLHKKKQHLKRVWAVEDINDFDRAFAGYEDNWDSLMQNALLQAGVKESGPPEGHLTTYTRSEDVSALWLGHRVRTYWNDLKARGQALNQIVEEEKMLAMIERAMSEWTEEQVKAVTEQIETEFKERQTLKGPVHPAPMDDPFLNRNWRNYVSRNEQDILRRQFGAVGHGRSGDNNMNQKQSKHRSGGTRPPSKDNGWDGLDPLDFSPQPASLDTKLTGKAGHFSNDRFGKPWSKQRNSNKSRPKKGNAGDDLSDPFASLSLTRRHL